jgi:anti-sigma factor RsiW
MAACTEYEERLDLHAAGALDDTEAVRVLHHLETCAGCREALAASVEVLSLAALPPPTASEQAAQAEVPRRALAAWRREAQRQGLRRRTLGALAAAAAVVALMLLVPGMPWRPSAGKAPVTEPAAGLEEVDAETMAAIEAWAGLEPLEEDWDDEELELNEGEPL